MTDRDDALRKELGWTGPEETDFEPPVPRPEPAAPAKPPVPSRPPVDFVAPDPAPGPSAEEAKDDERSTLPGAARVPPAPGPEPGPRGGQPDAPPPPFLDPERPAHTQAAYGRADDQHQQQDRQEPGRKIKERLTHG